MTGLVLLVVVFHFLILIKAIPHNIAWGGRLHSDQQIYVFEGISILINLVLIWVLSLKAKNARRKIIDIVLWIYFVIFSLNTIGNLFAKSTFERSFSIVTLLFALLLLRILLKKKEP